MDSATLVNELARIQGLFEKVGALGLGVNEPDAMRASAAEFVLEGLYAHRRINRNEELGFVAEEKRREAPSKDEGNKGRYRRQFN